MNNRNSFEIDDKYYEEVGTKTATFYKTVKNVARICVRHLSSQIKFSPSANWKKSITSGRCHRNQMSLGHKNCGDVESMWCCK